MTHNYLLFSTVIGLLQDGRIEIVEVEFPLKRTLVVGVKDVEGERCLRPLEGRRVPANPQELTISLDPPRIRRTRTKLYVEMVQSVGANYEEGLSFNPR